MNPEQVYAANIGNTHAAACDAVYEQGFADGVAGAISSNVIAPPVLTEVHPSNVEGLLDAIPAVTAS